MMPRPGWALGPVLCLALVGLEPAPGETAGEALWYQGQEAMNQGRPARAIACYKKSLALAPGLTRNYLSLAAAELELGDSRHACLSLGHYLASHPKDLEIRGQYAELLFRVRQLVQAREEFERCLLTAEEQDPANLSSLIRWHSRVMEIALLLGDRYGQHLHRGIGLYLLAQASQGLEDGQTELAAEGLLCKAAGRLRRAHKERPDEARPSWYLFATWSKLARSQPAQNCLRDAWRTAPFSYLTPAEWRGLYLACPDPAFTLPRR